MIHPVCPLAPLLSDHLTSFYWIGFLLADGSFLFDNARLTLEIKDEEHLRQFANHLTVPPNVHQRKRNGNFYLSQCGYRSFHAIVTKFDIKPMKTYCPPDMSLWQDRFTDEQLTAIMIGFFDGDGSMGVGQRGASYISLENHASWRSVLEFFIHFLDIKAGLEAEPRQRTTINCRGYVRGRIGKKAVLQFLLKFIEVHQLPVLARKWDRIAHVKDEPARKPRRLTKTDIHTYVSKDGIQHIGTENSLFHATTDLHSAGIAALTRGALKSYKGWRLLLA